MAFFPAFETLYFLPFLISFVFWWMCYFSARRPWTSSTIHKKSLVKVRARTLAISVQPSAILEVFKWPAFSTLVIWGLLQGFEDSYFLSHFFFSNTSFTFFFFLSAGAWFVWAWVARAEGGLGLAALNIDYLMALLHLLFYMPIIVLMNSLLGFFFVFELSSVLLFLSFVTLQNLNKRSVKKKKTSELDVGFNLIFFHFWSSFFSSILILYSILNFFFLFGTTEWAYLNLFLQTQLSYPHSQLLLFITLTLLVGGLLIKLGVGPFFAYKLELYQGLPLYALAFYSILYFALFLSSVFILFGFYLPTLLTTLRPLLMLGVIVFFVIFGFVLFDSLLLRQFFALSSLITSLNLLTLLI